MKEDGLDFEEEVIHIIREVDIAALMRSALRNNWAEFFLVIFVIFKDAISWVIELFFEVVDSFRCIDDSKVVMRMSRYS